MKNPDKLTISTQIALAKALIDDESRWCRHTAAEDASGAPCQQNEGVRFCAFGAVMKVTGTSMASMGWQGPMAYLHEGAAKVTGGLIASIVHMNDHYSHATVMKAFDAAIEMAIAKEKVNG